MSLLFFLAALVDPLSDPCLDDDHNNRCSPAKQAEMRASYRVPPIESYAGASVRRIFFVDGYGNETVAIEFVRAAQKDAIVRLHFPTIKGERPVSPVEQALGVDQWQQIISASRHFDKKFARSPTSAQVMCLHSWVYWAEALDPGAKARSTVDDACNDQPVGQFAWVAAKMAYQAIPFCAALDKRFSRNEATLLRTCSKLSGDRLAAAEVWNRASGMRSVDTPSGMDDLPAYNVEIDFQGRKLVRNEAREFWRSLMAKEQAPSFYYDRVHGLTADEVTVAGSLSRLAGNGKYQIADVELRWKKDGGTFGLTSVKVGPYHPLTLPTE